MHVWFLKECTLFEMFDANLRSEISLNCVFILFIFSTFFNRFDMHHHIKYITENIPTNVSSS